MAKMKEQTLCAVLIFFNSRFLFEIVVVYFDSESDERAHCGNDIGNHQWPVVERKALNDKENASEAQHAECGHCNAVGLTCAYCGNCLRQIAQNHADAGRVADDVDP